MQTTLSTAEAANCHHATAPRPTSAGLAWYGRRGRLDDGGFGPGLGARLDERQAAVVLHALQPAGVAMFVAAAVAGAALGGEPGDDSLRILAFVFAGVLLVRLVLFRPRPDGQ